MPRDAVIAVAREFADNAEKTNGRSMVILGAGLNHWYHMDMNYRGIINMLMLCGCIGQSGGGWAHYVGQEKLRPQTGWTALAFALDWMRPPRQMNGTSFFYAHTDQWRYEKIELERDPSPLADPKRWQRQHDRLQRARRAHGLAALRAAAEDEPAACGRARGRGAGSTLRTTSPRRSKSGTLSMSCEDPDHAGELAAQPVRLALEPARLQRQGPRILPQAPARHGNGVLGKDWATSAEARGSRAGTTRRPRASSTCWSRSTSA